MASFRNYLELHFVVFLWGFTAVLGKLISIPAVELVFIRTFIAAAALALILYKQKISLQIGRGIIIKILAVGFLISGHWILFFASARVASVAISLAGLSTVSLWTALLEPVFTKKKIRLLEIIMAFMIMIGLYLIFRFEFGHLVGILMAVASALLSSLFTIINAGLVKTYRAPVITCYEMAGACLATALFFPFYTWWFSETGTLNFNVTYLDWLWLLLLALVCTVYPFTASVKLMKQISAFTVNLSVNLEPIYGILFAFFIFKDSERMSGGFYVGAAIILLSVFVHAILEGYAKRKKKAKATLSTPDTLPETPIL
ncbi:DMT family transporter [Adhaeribacter aquaticus]|uniref:DMT family transporter n=1 Tax=Adhaeribacter aquaticus TaxID=299567 RepID=UPI0006877322|nr:DMT family transporter [Adhaeribacter aquaticus]